MRTREETQFIHRLNNQIKRLQKKNVALEKEMIERGKDITKMIKIFLVCENILPEGQRNEFRNVALEYAARNDNDRGSVYCMGIIDFQNVVR